MYRRQYLNLSDGDAPAGLQPTEEEEQASRSSNAVTASVSVFYILTHSATAAGDYETKVEMQTVSELDQILITATPTKLYLEEVNVEQMSKKMAQEKSGSIKRKLYL